MGMSNGMAPRYLTVSPSGQVTYILDSSTISLAQLQLALPASEVLVIQEEGKPVTLSENPILVADVSGENLNLVNAENLNLVNAENLNLLGNNVIVLVSQAQEVMIVSSELSVDSNSTQQWSEDEAPGAFLPGTVTHYVADMVTDSAEDEFPSTDGTESSPIYTVEDARCWFRDSLITTAALSSLTNFIQSREKEG